MSSSTASARHSQIRTYDRSGSAVFLKTRERYGGLSNMAGGFPLLVNGVPIRTTEALYQACRFPHLPNIQQLIIDQRSPMTAKMKGKPHRHASRRDWNGVRIRIMRWCLEVKLAQNWVKFGEALRETGTLPIVEHSRRDDFWGAKPVDGRTLVGVNALGRLLMELRERMRNEPKARLQRVGPLDIDEFLLCGRQIETVVATSADTAVQSAAIKASGSRVAEEVGSDVLAGREPKGARTYQIPLIADGDDRCPNRKLEKSDGRSKYGFQSLVRNMVKTLLECSPRLVDESDIENLMDAQYCKRELDLRTGGRSVLSLERVGRQVGGRHRFEYWKQLYGDRFYLRCGWQARYHRHNAERFSILLDRLMADNEGHPALARLQELKKAFDGLGQ